MREINRTLHELLRTLPVEKKRRWPEHLKEFWYAYNAKPHATTGYLPFYLMFGRDPRLPIDRLIELDETQGQEPSTWVSRHQKELRSAHRRAAEKLTKEAAIRKQRRVKPSIIEIGQRVLVKDRTICGRNKIQGRWSTKVHKVVDQLENGTLCS